MFEAGKRYTASGSTFEIISRTKTRAKVAYVAHPGKFNENLREVKTVKIHDWGNKEVIFTGHYELYA